VQFFPTWGLIIPAIFLVSIVISFFSVSAAIRDMVHHAVCRRRHPPQEGAPLNRPATE
jgi:ABC-type dipeptide/oligopeptide/nickel transport system permease subunit